MWAIAKAFEDGMGVEDVHELTRIDRWYLWKLHGLHRIKSTLRQRAGGPVGQALAERCFFFVKPQRGAVKQ